jgi:hypothetical protein
MVKVVRPNRQVFTPEPECPSGLSNARSPFDCAVDFAIACCPETSTAKGSGRGQIWIARNRKTNRRDL